MNHRDESLKSLLTEVTKKDDDARVYASGSHADEVWVETSLDLGSPSGDEEENTLIDSHMLADEATSTVMDVNVRVIRHIFMINAIVSFAILTGFIPYQFLVYDERHSVDIVVLAMAASLFLVTYIIMAAIRKTRYATIIFVFWVVEFYITSVSLSSVLNDLAPLQFSMITFIQSLGMIVYTVWSPSYINPWYSYYTMTLLGILSWGVGLYAFIEQRDWISASVLLLVTMGVSGYYAAQTHLATRFSLSAEDKMDATIRFYADPIIYPYVFVTKK
jgi:hypothetical protein